MSFTKRSSGVLFSLAYVAASQLLMRLIAFLSDVPSSPFSVRDGGKVFAGWVLLYAVCCLAIEAVLFLRRRWFTSQASPRAADPYLMAVAQLQDEAQGKPS
jgi:hypothetical protein